jgi:hypothetical protein
MSLSPRDLQDSLNKVSDELYERSQEAAEIAGRTGVAWLAIRKTCETNAEADQLFAATPDGSRMAYLKYYIRGLQAKRGALLQEVKANSGNSW